MRIRLLIAGMVITANVIANQSDRVRTNVERLTDAIVQYSEMLEVGIKRSMEVNKQRRAAGRISRSLYEGEAKSLQARMRTLRKDRYVLPSLYLWTLKKGDIGRLAGNLGSVSESDGETNRYRVAEVIDDLTMVIEGAPREAFVADSGETIWRQPANAIVEGIPTDGIATDSYIQLRQIFEVTELRRGQGFLGGDTWVLTQFSIQDPRPVIDRLKKRPTKPIPAIRAEGS